MFRPVYSGVVLSVVIFAALSRAQAQAVCQSAVRLTTDSRIDLAPPGQFTDVCSEDAETCKSLTEGYPRSASTLAYFVAPDEWKAFKQSKRGFTRYLIAQVAGSMAPSDLPGFKQYLHSRQGDIPDKTEFPSVLESRGRIPLGITSETPDSISFGVVMRLEPKPPVGGRILMASINSAVVVRDHVLSLYVFDEIRDPAAVDPVRSLSEQWLACLRQNNQKPEKK